MRSKAALVPYEKSMKIWSMVTKTHNVKILRAKNKRFTFFPPPFKKLFFCSSQFHQILLSWFFRFKAKKNSNERGFLIEKNLLFTRGKRIFELVKEKCCFFSYYIIIQQQLLYFPFSSFDHAILAILIPDPPPLCNFSREWWWRRLRD